MWLGPLAESKEIANHTIAGERMHDLTSDFEFGKFRQPSMQLRSMFVERKLELDARTVARDRMHDGTDAGKAFVLSLNRQKDDCAAGKRNARVNATPMMTEGRCAGFHLSVRPFRGSNLARCRERKAREFTCVLHLLFAP